MRIIELKICPDFGDDWPWPTRSTQSSPPRFGTKHTRCHGDWTGRRQAVGVTVQWLPFISLQSKHDGQHVCAVVTQCLLEFAENEWASSNTQHLKFTRVKFDNYRVNQFCNTIISKSLFSQSHTEGGGYFLACALRRERISVNFSETVPTGNQSIVTQKNDFTKFRIFPCDNSTTVHARIFMLGSKDAE